MSQAPRLRARRTVSIARMRCIAHEATTQQSLDNERTSQTNGIGRANPLEEMKSDWLLGPERSVGEATRRVAAARVFTLGAAITRRTHQAV